MKTMTYCRIARLTTVFAAVSAASALFAERQPYERYQSVVDRQMFGQPPPGFDPTKPPSEVSAKEEREKEQALTQEQEQVKSAIHFSMVNVTPSGDTAVGFTDNSDSKNPKHYYLKVGETRDGWTVKEADALKATMTIAKGEIEVSLELGGNSASGGGTTSKAGGGARAGGNAASRPGLPARMGNVAGGGASRGLGSLRERRALREQQRAADAQAAAEKEAQREQERAAEKARQEQEKAEREKEREEQRAQLMQIQEELRKAREERAKAEEKQKDEEQPKEEDPPKEGGN